MPQFYLSYYSQDHFKSIECQHFSEPQQGKKAAVPWVLSGVVPQKLSLKTLMFPPPFLDTLGRAWNTEVQQFLPGKGGRRESGGVLCLGGGRRRRW